MKSYRSLDIAKRFLELAQSSPDHVADISNMKLQKLVYFSQLVSVCSFSSVPICSDDIRAWDYGPVEPRLYRSIKKFGSQFFSLSDPSVADIFRDAAKIEDAEANDVISAVWEKFKGWTSIQLSALTHRRNSPWSITYANDRYGVIPVELMRQRKFGDA